jgi:hypothetical protein
VSGEPTALGSAAPFKPRVTDAEHAAVAKDPTQTLATFTLDDLAPYTREGSFDPRDSTDMRVFTVGRDDVHGVLKYLHARVTQSEKLSMFGFDDEELNKMIEGLIVNAHVFFQGTLDKGQAGGVHEAKILKAWQASVRAVFAIGSTASGQIEHTKGAVLDGIVAFEGSTNWSASGEGTGIGLHGAANVMGFKAQANTLTVFANPVELQRFGTRLDEEHASILQRQGAVPAAA